MIRYLIITLIFCSSVFAEIIEIDPGIKIKIPEGKAFYVTNPLDDFKNNAISRKFTPKEIKTPSNNSSQNSLRQSQPVDISIPLVIDRIK